MRWNLPCTGGGGILCNCSKTVSDEKVLKGNNSKTYKVLLRFRGVVETKSYSGGSADGAYFHVGGTPNPSLNNMYRMTISDPMQTYYLNSGRSSKVVTIDYQKEILISSGAKINIFADSTDSKQIPNSSRLAVPEVEPAYNGQFIQVNVINIEQQ